MYISAPIPMSVTSERSASIARFEGWPKLLFPQEKKTVWLERVEIRLARRVIASVVVRAHRVDVGEQRPDLGLDVVVGVTVGTGVVLAVRVARGRIDPDPEVDLERDRVVILRGRRCLCGVITAHRRDTVGLHGVLAVRVQDGRADAGPEVDGRPGRNVR